MKNSWAINLSKTRNFNPFSSSSILFLAIPCIIPLITDVIQLTLILKMTTAQAVELGVSHCQQQQFYSGLRSPGGSTESSYL